MYIMYANASNNTPSYTHVSSYVVWRVHPPPTPWGGGVATQYIKYFVEHIFLEKKT